jgi:flavin-dependent dehydrogenase
VHAARWPGPDRATPIVLSLISDLTYDVVIAGGGPAGATAARLLASWGHRVIVLTRSPSRHAIAESIPPSAGRLFERLEIQDAIDRAGFVRATGNTVRWANAETRREPFGENARGWQVDRPAFDALLLDLAERAGAIIQRGVDARLVTKGADGVRVDQMDARWLLDCTGRSGLVARHGWRRAVPGVRTLAVVAEWERPGGWEDVVEETHTLVESFGSGWAWSVPTSPSRRHVTVMVDPALTEVARRDVLPDVYHSELERTSDVRRLMEGARLVRQPWAVDASPYTFDRVAEDRLLLVGDAASFVDPLSSFGIKKALASSWLAAVVVNSSLSNPEIRTPALELFARRERAMYDSLSARTAELSREAARSHQSDFWVGRSDVAEAVLSDEPDVAALRADPRVVRAFAELRQRPSIRFRERQGIERSEQPTVRENRVVLETRFVVPGFAQGIRHVRNVDLVTLAQLAPEYEQVPDL